MQVGHVTILFRGSHSTSASSRQRDFIAGSNRYHHDYSYKPWYHTRGTRRPCTHLPSLSISTSASTIPDQFAGSMARIRVADPVHRGDKPGQPPSGDDGSSMGPAFPKPVSMARSHHGDAHESIQNIRSHSMIPERISSGIPVAEQPDEDPGLRNPGDFKQRQVGSATIRDLTRHTSLTMDRCSKERCCCGWHINPWA